VSARSPGADFLGASSRLKRRRRLERGLALVAVLATAIAVAVLVVVIAEIALKGSAAINLDFFTKGPATFGQSGGGIAPAIVGSAVLIGWATLMAVPVSILTALYVSEFAPPRVARAIRMALDMLSGVPAIIVGIFVFGLFVKGKHQSGYAGSFALAILMVPIISRSVQEVLTLVPRSLREASLALGVRRWRTVVSIVLPQTVGGIITGTILGIARAAGETAPLLFVSSVVANTVSTDARQALASIPLTIFTYSESPDPNDHAKAWAASLVLIVFVLVASISARALNGWRLRRSGLAP
jgi:phosphate transport system permease protein